MSGFWRWMMVAGAAAVLVLGAGCPRETTPASMQQTASTASDADLGPYVVEMAGDRFTPQVLSVPRGATVTFLNNCRNKHTVTPDRVTPGWPNSDEQYPSGMQPGEIYRWAVPTNAAPGTQWYYHCRFHGRPGDGDAVGAGMAGAVEVSNGAATESAY